MNLNASRLKRAAIALSIFSGFAIAPVSPSLAQSATPSPNAAAYLASNCANCHGTHGATKVPGSFPLAGLKADYIVEQMRAFKEGKRSATIMHQIAKGYSDEQIASLATYFSKQPKAQ